MGARRLVQPIFLAVALSIAMLGGLLQLQRASAEVPLPEVSPYLRAAIEADIKAKGYDYGGDCNFDVMYLAPGKWCSFVQSVNSEGAVVTYGTYASGDISTAKFVRQGAYGWVNPETGVGSPERVPALSAIPGEKPDSWIIEGVNFKPGDQVSFFDGSGCGGEQRCPGDHLLGTATVNADGSLKITLQLNPEAKPLPGQTKRLIQASNGSFVQTAFEHDGSAQPTPSQPTPSQPAPTQPAPPQPTPQLPPTGDSDGGDGDGDAVVFGAAAIAGIAVLGALGFVTVSRRK